MEILITIGGIIGILIYLAILALLGWALIASVGAEESSPTLSTKPKGETVGERLTQVLVTAPTLLDPDPIETVLETTRQTVEERADAATLEILYDIDETFYGRQ